MQFWFSRLTGAAANQMMMVAVAWQMYDLTGSAWDLGLVGLLQFAPALVLTLVAGHVAALVLKDQVKVVRGEICLRVLPAEGELANIPQMLLAGKSEGRSGFLWLHVSNWRAGNLGVSGYERRCS